MGKIFDFVVNPTDISGEIYYIFINVNVCGIITDMRIKLAYSYDKGIEYFINRR